jgi:hypothetical protein
VRIPTRPRNWDIAISSDISNYHNHFKLETPISLIIPNYQFSVIYNRRSVHDYVRSSINISVNNHSTLFPILSPSSTLPFCNIPLLSNNKSPPFILQQYPEAFMHRFNNFLSAFHDHNSTTLKDAQNIIKLLTREFEASIQLTEFCGDVDGCAVF